MPDPSQMAELLRAGGWPMLPLYGCSVLGVAWTLHLAVRARVEGLGRRELLAVSTTDLDRLLLAARRDRTALGRVVIATLAALHETPDRAADIAMRAALAELDRWEGPLEVLALLARVAPLFGLLGTVLGLVDLFAAMEIGGAGVDPGALSGGIWKALLTTAAGLGIAIPALAAHAWFQRRVDRLRLTLEDGVGRVLDAAARRPR